MLGEPPIINVNNYMLTKIFFAVGFGFCIVFLVWYFVNTQHVKLTEDNIDIDSAANFDDLDTSFAGRGTVTRLPNTILSREEGVSISDQAVVDHPKKTVVVDDFYKVGEDEGKFSVYYDRESGAFTITLAGSDSKLAREAAESYLLKELSYTKEEWCKFDLSVVTNSYEDPRWAGINLGLSFCPGSVQL